MGLFRGRNGLWDRCLGGVRSLPGRGGCRSQRFQRLPHLGRARIAGRRVPGAGLEHHRRKGRVCLSRGRQGLAGEPPGAGVLLLVRRDVLRRGRIEGHPVHVQQLVEHQPQRVDVHAACVAPALEHLRGHVVHGARPGGGRHGRAGDAGHAEIAQLETALLGKEDVAGLDVPVDDVVFLAHFQRAAQVDAQAKDLGPGEDLLPAQVVVDGPEQLHADEDIPPAAVWVGVGPVVLIADDGAVALEPLHQGDLLFDVIDIFLEVVGHAFLVHAAGQDRVQLILRGRDGQRLHGAGAHGAQGVAALDLEHLAVAARADEPPQPPLAEKRLIAPVIFLLHGVSSS